MTLAPNRQARLSGSEMKIKKIKSEDKLIEMFVGNLRREFGGKLKKIILFGSRAREDYTKDSDYDFILIFDAITKELKDRLYEIEGNMLLEYGMVITAIPYTDKDIEKRRFLPFLLNVEKKGGNVVKGEIKKTDIKVAVEKGKRALEDGKILFADKRYESASSRVYYSIFHLLQAALLTHGLSFSKHSAVISHFSKIFLKTEILPKEFSKIIGRLRKDREIVDYDYIQTIEEDEIKADIADAEKIVKTIEEYLMKEGFT